MPRVDRLTGSDLVAITMQRLGSPQDIGAIAFLQPDRLLDPDGRIRIGDVRMAVARHLPLVPRFRQLIRRPRPGLGRPFWADAERVDLDYHVVLRDVGPGRDERALLDTVEALRQEAFDWTRPLWRMWLLTGLHDGRIAMYLRAHHALADGVAGVALLGRLLTPSPDPPDDPGPAASWSPRPPPSNQELLRDGLERVGAALAGTGARLAHPALAVDRIRRLWPALRETFAERPAPHTSLNTPIGPDRRMALLHGRLQSTRDAARAAGATVNDLVLASIGDALRDVLRSRGEATQGLTLRVAVPVSLHRESPASAHGNAAGPMAVPLPLTDADSHRRLQRIAADTARRRARPRPQFFSGVLASPFMQRAGLFWWRRQRFVNVYLANVVGPASALYLAGERLQEIFPVVPLTGNVTLGVGVLSYDGQLNVTVVADRRSWPDLSRFVGALDASLTAFRAATTAPVRQAGQPPRTSPARR